MSLTDADILNLAEDCGLMVEIEELESWTGMFAVDKAGLQKFARRVEAEAQSAEGKV